MKPRIKERPENKKTPKIRVDKNKDAKGGQTLWWKKQENWHDEVFPLLDYLDQNQPVRSLLNRYFRAVFRNRPALARESANVARSMGLPDDRLMLNVLKSVVNTKKSRIAKNNGRTRILTNNANWSTRERALMLEKFCAGLDRSQDTHGQMKRMFTDAEVCGTGAVKVYADGKEIVTEWTDIERIVVDEEACIGGKAYELHDRVWLPVETVLEEYADIFTEEQIENARSAERAKRRSGNAAVADKICVVESWKINTGSRNNGLRTICIKGASWGEEWKQDKAPFAFLRSEVTEGFYGEGAGERINPLTTELNKLLRNGHLGIALGSVYSWMVNDDAEVEDVEISNEVGRIVRWSGTAPPQKEVSNSVPPEIWQQIDWLYQMAFRSEGVSEQSAAARKEPGITAAVAMREQSDLETDRMSILAQDFEWARVQINELQIEAARGITGYKVKFHNDDGYEEIAFAEVDMERDQVVMTPYPGSSLPHTPAARAQWIEERMQSGLIPVEVGRKLMQMPDIEREMSILTAAARDVDKTLDRMMRAKVGEDGKPVYMPPEPFQNLLLARDRATAKYLELRLIEGVPTDRLALLQQYAQQAHDLIMKQKAEEAALTAPPQAPGPMPGAAMPQQPAMPALPVAA